MKQKKIKVGIIGCGAISGIYLRRTKIFKALDVVACADLDISRARAKATEHGIPKACTVKQLLGIKGIDIALNLTVPAAHAPVSLACVKAGKSVYSEKPMTIEREDAQKLMRMAARKKVRLGGAPDTFLGAGIQTCRKLMDEGAIGKPVGATAFMLSGGVETWHPNPEFYYKWGGGPMLDMGPYYLTALINLLGPIQRVAGAVTKGRDQRIATCKEKHGLVIDVDVPTHVTGLLNFQCGAVGTIVTSFDVPGGHHLPRIEVYGTEGTLSVPDPNTFKGPVKLKRVGQEEWQEMPLQFGYAENTRGLGVADMAHGLLSGRPHRANGDLTYHVLDIMHAIHESAAKGRHVKLQSMCDQPAPFPVGMEEGVLDD